MRHTPTLAIRSGAFLALVLGPVAVRPADTPLAVTGPVSSLGDTCATAIVVPWSDITSPAGYLTTGATGNTNDVPVTCAVDGSDTFYTFTAGADSTLDLTTCSPGNSSDTVLSLKTFANCTLNSALGCNDDRCSACTAAPVGFVFNSTLTSMPVTAGVQYAVQIDNWASAGSAPFVLRILQTNGTMVDRALFQSFDPLGIVDPAHIVALPITSPHFQPIPHAPVVYYQVDGEHCSAGHTTLRVVRRGLDGEFSF